MTGSPRTRLAMAAFGLLVTAAPQAQQRAGGAPPPSAPQQFVVAAHGHRLAVWMRAPASPTLAVVLVHGRTWSSRPDFDLQVSGLKRSVMQSLADRGIAAYAVDLPGYGASPRDASGYNTPNSAAADVAAVVDWVAARHPSLPPPALVGWSNGAVVALHVAQERLAKVSSAVLFGFTPSATYDITEVPAEEPAPRTPNTADAAASDFITPAVTPDAVVHAFVAQAMAADPIFAEWTHEEQWNVLRADRMRTPFLILYGDKDPGADTEAAVDYIRKARAPIKERVVISGADHCAQLEDTHEVFVNAVAAFVLRAAGVTSKTR